MTRRDYELIAAVFRAEPEILSQFYKGDALGAALATHDNLASGIAERIARDNPAFDRARFLRDCGVRS